MNTTDIIKAVQRQLGLDDDGDAGKLTWGAIYKTIVGNFAETEDVTTLIVAVQDALDVAVTGIANDNTWLVLADRLGISTGVTTPQAQPPAAGLNNSPVDARSEGVIATLLPQVQVLARSLVHATAAQGITIKIISGLRTYAEQHELYRKGRETDGPKVTNADAGFSNHNFGLAFDIGVFEGNNYIDESPKYKTVGPLGEQLGLAWGGRWVTIQDEPHYELRPTWAAALSEGKMLAVLRERKDSGQDFLA